MEDFFDIGKVGYFFAWVSRNFFKLLFGFFVIKILLGKFWYFVGVSKRVSIFELFRLAHGRVASAW